MFCTVIQLLYVASTNRLPLPHLLLIQIPRVLIDVRIEPRSVPCQLFHVLHLIWPRGIVRVPVRAAVFEFHSNGIGFNLVANYAGGALEVLVGFHKKE